MPLSMLSAENQVAYIVTYVVIVAVMVLLIAAGVRVVLHRRCRFTAPHKHMPAGRFIALGFAGVIFFGSLLLYLPITHKPGASVSYIEALFTSTSAVCVTGLTAFDTYDTFNFLGQLVIIILIQIGGLGIASVGVGIIAISGRKANIRDRYLVKEALNYDSFSGIIGLLRWVLMATLLFESVGAVLSIISFSRDYDFWRAVWMGIFHSISSFNNAGFDIVGGGAGLAPYADDVYMNVITALLIIFGGLGFYAMKEIITKRSFKRLSLNTKVAVSTTIALIVGGTLLLGLTNDISWLGAFFTSVSARTAGFQTVILGGFTNAGLLVVIILMFIGTSPGSTGGGVKTTTFFVLIRSITSIITNRDIGAFKRKFSNKTVFKAFLIFVTAMMVCVISTLILCITEPELEFMQILFEVVSAFSTCGLSTGVTASITPIGKLVLVSTMFIGRIGPLTAVTLLAVSPPPSVSRPEESISIG